MKYMIYKEKMMKISKLLNFKYSKLYMLIIFVLSILSSVLTIIYPMIVGDIVDRIGYVDIGHNMIVLLVIFVSLFVVNIILHFVLSIYTTNLSKSLREKLYRKLDMLSLTTIEKEQNGNIINIFSTDIENISNGLIQNISKILMGITTILLALYMMITLNMVITFILVAISILMFFISKFIIKNTSHLFDKRANTLGNLNSYIEEIISSKPTLDNYHYDKKIEETFDDKNTTLYHYGYKAQFYSSLTNPSTRLISNALYVLIGIIGIIFAKSNILTIGNISSFLLYTNIFTRPFNEISSIFSEIQTAISSMKRVLTFMKHDISFEFHQKHLLPISHLDGIIEFKNVCFSYEKDKPLIKNLSLYIPKNKSIAIVGKTGSGKTTIINLLSRFYEIQSGELLVDGINIQNMDISFLRKHIGVVLQDSKLFNGTIYENIAYATPSASREEVIHAAKLAYVDTFIKRLPNGYDTVIHNANLLSEGEVQLINIARMILAKPPILILDEATSNIDLLTESKVQKALSNLIEHSTSIIIAHRLSTIVHCDTIAFIENGEIVEMGTHKELLDKKGKYYELYTSQYSNQIL